VAVDVGVGPASPVGLAVPLASRVGALLVVTVGEEVGDAAGVAVPLLDCDMPAEVVREVLGVSVALVRGEEVEEGEAVPTPHPPLPGVRVPCAALAVPSLAKEGDACAESVAAVEAVGRVEEEVEGEAVPVPVPRARVAVAPPRWEAVAPSAREGVGEALEEGQALRLAVALLTALPVKSAVPVELTP
jgi:hypothetical protein